MVRHCILFRCVWFQVVVTFVHMIPVLYFSADQECAYDLTAFVAVINKLLPIEWCATNTRIALRWWSFFIIL
jgi:hypothetical protein